MFCVVRLDGKCTCGCCRPALAVSTSPPFDARQDGLAQVAPDAELQEDRPDRSEDDVAKALCRSCRRALSDIRFVACARPPPVCSTDVESGALPAPSRSFRRRSS